MGHSTVSKTLERAYIEFNILRHLATLSLGEPT
jgi:hypothetical protein